MQNYQRKCCTCEWLGKNSEMKCVKNKPFKGVTAWDLVCPKCGGRDFYIIGKMKPLFIPLQTFCNYMGIEMKTKYIFSIIIGVPSFIGLVYYAGIETAICIFLCIWANNIGR